MTKCNRNLGKRFLAGGLDVAEEPAFIEHLDTCASCQRWLEQESGDDDTWKMAKDMLSFPRSKGEEGLESDATAVHSSTQGERGTSAYPELAYLHPSDDPAMLGRLGSLEVIGVLGRGGMGVVFKCFDPTLRRNVAVKLLDPVLAHHGAARQRFAREARAMAAISHEHVVPIYAVDEHAELPYLVMEYVPGGTLERRLLRDGSFNVVDVIRVSLQIAAALAAAHRQGLVHRDIKPSNVLLDQGTERVRVTDFGLARAANDGTFTRTGTLAGTPQFMAPEQVRGEACDAQSDLFSLGSVMYTLCAGHPPFRGETVYAVMQRIVHDQPRSLREQGADIPAWLEDLIFRLLAKNKTDRFATADEVAKILELELAYQQSSKTGIEPARVWRRSCRRSNPLATPLRRRAIAVCAAIVLVLLSGWWLAFGPRSGRNESPVRPAASLQITSDERTVPLWEFDGMREAQAAAKGLELQSRQTTFGSESDPWEQQALLVRRRLADISANRDDWVSDSQ